MRILQSRPTYIGPILRIQLLNKAVQSLRVANISSSSSPPLLLLLNSRTLFSSRLVRSPISRIQPSSTFSMLHRLHQSIKPSTNSPPPSPPKEVTAADVNGVLDRLAITKKMSFAPDDPIESLLVRNEEWAEKTNTEYPDLFPELAVAQKPQILWFGCSDSRVPESTILNLLPGQVFVHRNIANCLPSNDLSSLSVLQYAVEVVKVKHIIVCGHYGCGGVLASLGNEKLGLIDVWLKNIRDVRVKHQKELDAVADEKERLKLLVRLNTVAQVHSLLHNSNVIQAQKERGLQVHGFVYDVGSGKLIKLEVPGDGTEQIYDLSPKELQDIAH